MGFIRSHYIPISPWPNREPGWSLVQDPWARKNPISIFYGLRPIAPCRPSVVNTHETARRCGAAHRLCAMLLGFRASREMTYRRFHYPPVEIPGTLGSKPHRRGHRPTGLPNPAMLHRMPKVRVPDIVQPNYCDVSPIMELLRGCLVTSAARLILFTG